MPSVKESLNVDLGAGPVEAFALVADFGRLAEWDPGVVSSAWRSGGPVVGAVCDVVVTFLGRPAAVTYELIEHEPPRIARYVARARFMDSVDTVVVDPAPDGSRLSLSAEVHLRGPLLLLRPVLPRVFARSARRAVAALRRRFGDGAGPRRS